MAWLIIGVVTGLAGLTYLTLVALSFFMGGSWGARAAYGLFGGVALILSIGAIRFGLSLLRAKRAGLSRRLQVPKNPADAGEA